MRGRDAGKKTFFQQQRCTQRQHYQMNHRFVSLDWFLSLYVLHGCWIIYTVLPQGWHNLGLLVEEGFRLPLSVLVELNLSELYLADSTLLLSTLYKKYVSLFVVYIQYMSCWTLFPPSLSFPTDAGTQKKQIPICLAAFPSSVCIFSPFKRKIVTPLRSVWYPHIQRGTTKMINSILYIRHIDSRGEK